MTHGKDQIQRLASETWSWATIRLSVAFIPFTEPAEGLKAERSVRTSFV